MNDPYETLGLPRDATRDQVKRAYKSLSHRCHPDCKTPDEAKFREVNEAYEVLQDPVRRAHYDSTGETGPITDHRAKVDEYLRKLFYDSVNQLKRGVSISRDIIQASKDDVGAAIEEIERNLASTVVAIEALEMAQGRVQCDGDNLFDAILEAEIASMRQGIDGGSKQIELLKAVYDELGKYRDRSAGLQ